MNKALTSRIEAAKLRLGVKGDTWSEADVRIAAATKLRSLHPDTGGVVSAEAGTQIAKVKSDRALLSRFATPETKGTKCPHCEGTGYVLD